MRTLQQRIIDWNRTRNSLAFDPNLEVVMLREEASEFYMSSTLVDRIDAYCDFLFVSVGTRAKFGATKAVDCKTDWVEMKELFEWITFTLNEMKAILIDELECNSGILVNWEHVLDTVFLDIVVNANEAKGTEKDENGKVKKGPDYKKPEAEIERVLNEKMNGRW